VFGLGWVRISWVGLCKEAVSKVWFVLFSLVVECINLLPGHRNRRKIRIRKKKKSSNFEDDIAFKRALRTTIYR
jgi:hypothetical protein